MYLTTTDGTVIFETKFYAESLGLYEAEFDGDMIAIPYYDEELLSNLYIKDMIISVDLELGKLYLACEYQEDIFDVYDNDGVFCIDLAPDEFEEMYEKLEVLLEEYIVE